MRSIIATILASIMLAINVMNAPSAQELVRAESDREQIVLLHGLARSPSHMAPLESVLTEAGYDVFNLAYPSTTYTIDDLTLLLQQKIDERIDPERTVHYVGYSMGGIMIRALLNRKRPLHLGRVVQLAAPNGGSEVADLLEGFWLYEAIFGPAGSQLITDPEALSGLLGHVDYELGVIAGDFSIDPVSSTIIIGPDDGKVSVESTRVEGMLDHIIVSASHTFFPSNDDVHRQTLSFLKNGKFLH